jgi:hypothetical protein
MCVTSSLLSLDPEKVKFFVALSFPFSCDAVSKKEPFASELLHRSNLRGFDPMYSLRILK